MKIKIKKRDFGGLTGGVGFGINSEMPFNNFSPFSPYVSGGLHDMYGGETNVLRGLSQTAINSTYSGGPVFLSTSTSTSAIPLDPSGAFVPASYGTRSTYFGWGLRSANFGANQNASYSRIWSLKK